MSEKDTGESRKPIQVFRERRGDALKRAQERHRETMRVRREILKALRQKPGTVPEISEVTGLERHTVFWHLMAMKKYGEVVEGEERSGYYVYLLKEEKEGGKES